MSSINSTSPGTRELRTAARSPSCWIAGPLDMRNGRPPSCPPILATLLLPHPAGPPPLVRDDHRERRLAEPGWTRQQNVIGSTLLQHSRREQQLQLPSHLCLPDELAESARAQRTLLLKLRLRCEGRVGEVLTVGTAGLHRGGHTDSAGLGCEVGARPDAVASATD